jgi:hypothetical protein
MEHEEPTTTPIEATPGQSVLENHLGRRRFLKGIGYGSLALAGTGLLTGWYGQTSTHAVSLVTSPWEAAPVLLRVSDAVKPGELLTIYGEGIGGDGLQISLAEAHGNPVPETPPGDAFSLSPVFTDPEGHFASVVLPATREAGTYHLWVKNSYGWSKPILLNGAGVCGAMEQKSGLGESGKTGDLLTTFLLHYRPLDYHKLVTLL